MRLRCSYMMFRRSYSMRYAVLSKKLRDVYVSTKRIAARITMIVT
jgi:hypothetical protein